MLREAEFIAMDWKENKVWRHGPTFYIYATQDKGFHLLSSKINDIF